MSTVWIDEAMWECEDKVAEYVEQLQARITALELQLKTTKAGWQHDIDKVKALEEENKQLQIEISAKDVEFEGIYGWLGDRLIEYGRFKDGDKIIERIGVVVEEYLIRTKAKEVSPSVLKLRKYIRKLQADLAKQTAALENIRLTTKQKRYHDGTENKDLLSDCERIAKQALPQPESEAENE